MTESRVDRALRASAGDAGRRAKGAVIPFIVGGFPSMDATEATLEALSESGAGLIEIGVPFSDPIADGPVISEAMRRAIEGGATPASLLASLARVRPKVRAAIVLMVSVSIVERIGRERFVSEARRAGADGLIVPDLDLDEAPAFAALCGAHGLTLSMLVAPASSRARQQRIAESSSGFIYLLARQGVTGTSTRRAAGAPGPDAGGAAGEQEFQQRVAVLRELSPLPIACGFGISKRDQVEAVLRHADAAIVGSAFVRAMDGRADARAAASAAVALYRELTAT